MKAAKKHNVVKLGITISLLLFCLGGFAQKNKKPTNYLRRGPAEPETWFTLAGKKNGSRVKAAELAKAEGIKPTDKLEGLTITSMDVVIVRKGESTEEEKISIEGKNFSEEVKTKFSELKKGDRIIIYLHLRNRSTQATNTITAHKYSVSG